MPLGILGFVVRGLMLGGRTMVVGMADFEVRHSLAEVRLS